MESSPNTNPKTPKDETNSKGSPDTSAINDPIALRHQHRFDVSRQKRGIPLSPFIQKTSFLTRLCHYR